MAILTGSTIASSYDQLLALPTGGGDGATLVALTDGNAGNTFALQVSTGGIKSTGTLAVTGITTATGGVVGDLTGDVTGDLTGNVTAASVLADGVTATTQAVDNDSTKVATTAFVVAQVETSDTLAEVLANGNTTGATDLVVTAGQAITTDTISETTSASGVTIDSVLVKDNAVTATTFTGALTGNCSGTAATVTGAAQTAITSVGTLTGLSMSGNLAMADDAEILVGTGSDLKIYHNGANSFIEDSGTGSLRVLASQFYLNNAADNETMIDATENGAVNLYYNYVQRLSTNTTGVNVSGNLSVTGSLGVGRTPTTYELEVAGEAQITSTGAGGVLGLVNAQGNLWIGVDTTSAYLQTSSGEDFRIVADSTVALTAATDGAVDLAASKLKIGGSYGTDGHVLTSTGSGVAWEAPTAVTVTGATQAAITSAANLATVGTITTGTWEGTTIAVDQGGTGATSLTSGSVLLGSGTGAITAMNVLAAGEIIIGDGVGDPSKLVIGADNSAITILGTIGTGVWNGTAIDGAYVDIEGTEVKSAGPITDGYVLTADGSGGAAWEASAGGGKVLQVLNNTGTVADASATSATAAVSQAITPAASSNTVLVTAIANFSLDHDDDNFETGDMRWQLFRGSTALGNEQKYVNNNSGLSWTANTMYYCCSFTFKDSPATASAATYSLKYYQANTANPVAVVHDAQITVQEID